MAAEEDVFVVREPGWAELELAELEQPPRAPRPPAARPPAEYAAEDVAIDRPDLPGAYVQVRKGDVIPAELVSLPRRPLHEPPAAVPGRRRRGRKET